MREKTKIAAALWPGSRKVWNRKTGRWDGFPDVKYVPFIVHGWTNAVARSSSNKEAAFDVLGFSGNKENHTADLLKGRFGINPFRHYGLDTRFWIDAPDGTTRWPDRMYGPWTA
jgi:ABC-type glycerol-3-phosphate transport system substrate-binding protein